MDVGCISCDMMSLTQENVGKHVKLVHYIVTKKQKVDKLRGQ